MACNTLNSYTRYRVIRENAYYLWRNVRKTKKALMPKIRWHPKGVLLAKKITDYTDFHHHVLTKFCYRNNSHELRGKFLTQLNIEKQGSNKGLVFPAQGGPELPLSTGNWSPHCKCSMYSQMIRKQWKIVRWQFADIKVFADTRS